jgi:hypothetical protein
MRFSQIVKGIRQDKSIELPPYIGQPPDQPCMTCCIRALNDVEEELALGAAVKRAKDQGAAKPEPGDPIYDLALMVEVIALACCDPDSPTGARDPFFDGGPDQVRQHFGREATTLIYETQQQYQDDVAPTLKRLTPIEYYGGLHTLGGEDEERARSFFVRCSVGLRWSYMRTLAVQLLNSLQHSSASGTTSEANGPTSNESQPTSSEQSKNSEDSK